MRSVSAFLAVALASASCGDDGTAGATARPAADRSPTFHRDVQPLLARHCASCHAPGRIAPFSLDTYEEAEALSGSMADAVQARRMPPYPVDNSGACTTFRDARWMTDEEIAVFTAWHDAGAPRGEPTAPSPPAELPSLRGATVAVSTGVDYAPDPTLADDYRCFVADVPAEAEAAWVTGFDVHPGNPALVHHVIAYHPTKDAAAERVRELDAEDPAPGYACFGGPGAPAGAVAAWAPGGGATRFPDGAGIALEPGKPLVLQVHYNTLAGGGGTDRSELVLEVAREVAAPARFSGVFDLGLQLPPRSPDVAAETTAKLGKFDAPVLVAGVFPHMHTLGETLRIDVHHPDGTTDCLVDVPRWDFHWQMIYFHDQPLTVAPDDVLSLRCTYDTRSRETDTRWGEGTEDEMCIAGLFVVP